MDLIGSPHVLSRQQVRFPRSKRKRIRKKWAKQEKNFALRPSNKIYYIGQRTCVIHPELLKEIRRIIDAQEDAHFGLVDPYDQGTTLTVDMLRETMKNIEPINNRQDSPYDWSTLFAQQGHRDYIPSTSEAPFATLFGAHGPVRNRIMRPWLLQ